ncbi:MAG: glycerol-3-phosphate dehydrogenase/oxidase [Reichenbachiella sp.]
MSTVPNSRQQNLANLKKEYFDVIIIGGGVTGAGIALDASSRGLKVALVEKNDFASGTSSKSTKLIHGGLRYLKQYEFSLVREVGKERAIVHKLAPQLVRPEKMLLPLIKDGNYGKIITSVGLMVYDVLADVDSEDQRKMLSVKETLDVEPLLNENILEGGGLYSEYQTDDFRLVIELIKKSQEFGAVCLNYFECLNFLEKGGKICGVNAKDRESEESIEIYSDYVINAGGPWADELRRKQEKIQGKKLHLTKGVHIVVPFSRLPVKQSIYFDVSDGRMIFAIPKKNVTYIGTTDTGYTGNPGETRTTLKDVEYLIHAVNTNFPSVELVVDDIESSWSGVRPLIEEEGKSASEISRKDEIFVSEKGLITITGGKLTGYRKMAKRAIDQMLEIRSDSQGIHKSLKSKTKKIKLPGNQFDSPKAIEDFKVKLREESQEIGDEEINYMVDLYGGQTEEIIKNFKSGNSDELILSEVDFCIEQEMTLHLVDFFIYRTGRLFFNISSAVEKKHVVGNYMRNVFNWSDQQLKNEMQKLDDKIQEATTFN